MPDPDYYAKRAARIARLQARAAGRHQVAEGMLARALKMAEAIPFGQPILVGHHSEGRDRRYRGRIQSTFERAAEAQTESEDMERRALAAEANDSISSDAPDAVERLEAKLADMQKLRELYKAINKAIRSKDPRTALVALGCTVARAEGYLRPDCMGCIGIPSYRLSNLGANIRRVEQRLQRVRALHTRAAQQEAAGDAPTLSLHGCEIVSDAAANRTRIRFPGKPSDACRSELKSNGFRWSPMEGVWQRHLSNGAEYMAKAIVERHYAPRVAASSE